MPRFALLVGLLVAACAVFGCRGSKALGETCQSDRECRDGTCFELGVVQEICSGRVCTAACEQDSDCPPGPGLGNCEHLTERSVCLYAGWVAEHCRMPSLPTE